MEKKTIEDPMGILLTVQALIFAGFIVWDIVRGGPLVGLLLSYLTVRITIVTMLGIYFYIILMFHGR